VDPLGPVVEVRLGEAAAASLSSPAPVEVIRSDDGVRIFRGDLAPGADPVVLRLDSGRIAVGQLADPGPIEIRLASPLAAVTARLRLEMGEESPPRRYRGALVFQVKEGVLRVSNKLSLEEYLAGVVGAEMAASVVPVEALKAQAVAARTYALFALSSAGERGRRPRFAAGATFQAYGGVEKEHPRVLEAVRSTTGEVLTYRGGLFRAYFHSTCGGRTASASWIFGEPGIEPLAGAPCGACGDARFARWEAHWATSEIEEALRPWAARHGLQLEAVEALEVVESEADGRVRYVRVRHPGGSFEVLGSKLRALLEAARRDAAPRSTAFTVAKAGTSFRFEGTGWGHGIGLCQTGAARKGETEDYRAILRDYFPGSEVERAY
jgi:stage II sporulation protein D